MSITKRIDGKARSDRVTTGAVSIDVGVNCLQKSIDCEVKLRLASGPEA